MFPWNYRKAVTLIELLVVIGIAGFIMTFAFVNLAGKKNRQSLDSTAKNIEAFAHEAQSNAIAQASSSAWGIHFENSTSSFFTLFAGAYSPTSTRNRASLPPGVRFATSSIPASSTLDVTFAQITGIPSTSTVVQLQLVNGTGASITVIATSTLTITSRGVISL